MFFPVSHWGNPLIGNWLSAASANVSQISYVIPHTYPFEYQLVAAAAAVGKVYQAPPSHSAYSFETAPDGSLIRDVYAGVTPVFKPVISNVVLTNEEDWLPVMTGLPPAFPSQYYSALDGDDGALFQTNPTAFITQPTDGNSKYYYPVLPTANDNRITSYYMYNSEISYVYVVQVRTVASISGTTVEYEDPTITDTPPPANLPSIGAGAIFAASITEGEVSVEESLVAETTDHVFILYDRVTWVYLGRTNVYNVVNSKATPFFQNKLTRIFDANAANLFEFNGYMEYGIPAAIPVSRYCTVIAE